MWRGFIIAASMACALSACSDPPPTPAQYAARTRSLEADIVTFIWYGYRSQDFGVIQDDTLNQWVAGGDVKTVPGVCVDAAKALNRAVWSTALEWPYDKWREAYALYVDDQAKCEQAIDGKPSRRVLPANLLTRKQLSDLRLTQGNTLSQ